MGNLIKLKYKRPVDIFRLINYSTIRVMGPASTSPLSFSEISARNNDYFRKKVAETKLSIYLVDVVHDFNEFFKQ